MTLYHYTCSHSVPGIRAAGELRPNPRVTWLPRLVWLTDLPEPWADALGLTSLTLGCDRTRHRFEVADASTVVPWMAYRQLAHPAVREALETAPGAMPRHWFVSAQPVPIRKEASRAQ